MTGELVLLIDLPDGGLTPRQGPPDTAVRLRGVTSDGHTIRVAADATVGRVAGAATVGAVTATAKAGR